MYVRGKQIKGHTYYYLVKSERHGKKVVQKFIGYIGKAGRARPLDLAAKGRQQRIPKELEALAQKFKGLIEEAEEGIKELKARLKNPVYRDDIKSRTAIEARIAEFQNQKSLFTDFYNQVTRK